MKHLIIGLFLISQLSVAQGWKTFIAQDLELSVAHELLPIGENLLLANGIKHSSDFVISANFIDYTFMELLTYEGEVVDTWIDSTYEYVVPIGLDDRERILFVGKEAIDNEPHFYHFKQDVTDYRKQRGLVDGYPDLSVNLIRELLMTEDEIVIHATGDYDGVIDQRIVLRYDRMDFSLLEVTSDDKVYFQVFGNTVRKYVGGGALLWEKNYNEEYVFYDAVENENGDIYLVGKRGDHAAIVKLDSDGQYQAIATQLRSDFMAGPDIAYTGIKLVDDKVIAMGTDASYNPFTNFFWHVATAIVGVFDLDLNEIAKGPIGGKGNMSDVIVKDDKFYGLTTQQAFEFCCRAWFHSFSPKSTSANDVYEREMVLYPIPASEFLEIRIGDNFNSETRLQVINGFGEKVESLIVRGKSTQLDISDYPSGVYFIIDGHGRAERFVVLND